MFNTIVSLFVLMKRTFWAVFVFYGFSGVSLITDPDPDWFFYAN